jgi:hypothetical protein
MIGTSMQVVFGQPTAHMDHAAHDLRTNELMFSNRFWGAAATAWLLWEMAILCIRTDLKY